MSEKSTDILKEINRRDGMTVPEGYFEQLNRRIMAQLPELPADEEPRRSSLWLKIRPYAYMAAMFGGIYCMMQLFDIIQHPKTDLNIESFPALTATLSDENSREIVFDIDDYDIIEDLINSGVTPDELLFSDDSIVDCSDNI